MTNHHRLRALGLTCTHILLIVASIALLTLIHQGFMVLVLGQFDPKFGPAGTLQIALLIMLATGSLSALGAGLSQLWHLISKPQPGTGSALNIPLALGIGCIFVLLQAWLLPNLPLLTGGNESLQLLVVYPLLGLMLHRAGLLIHASGRQNARPDPG